MKSKDVQLGQVYVVKVSGKLTRVRLDSESPYGGWSGTNLETKREVRIKTAAKLRRPADWKQLPAADYLPDDLALIHLYDACAEWCAKRGLQGKIGDLLPNLVSSEVVEMINSDPEAFEQRVRQCAYALAMNKQEGQ